MPRSARFYSLYSHSAAANTWMQFTSTNTNTINLFIRRNYARILGASKRFPASSFEGLVTHIQFSVWLAPE